MHAGGVRERERERERETKLGHLVATQSVNSVTSLIFRGFYFHYTPQWFRTARYWATRSSVRSFARTVHSFAYYALLTLLIRSAALIHSLTHSLTPGLVGKYKIRYLKMTWFCPTVHSSYSDLLFFGLCSYQKHEQNHFSISMLIAKSFRTLKSFFSRT